AGEGAGEAAELFVGGGLGRGAEGEEEQARRQCAGCRLRPRPGTAPRPVSHLLPLPGLEAPAPGATWWLPGPWPCFFSWVTRLALPPGYSSSSKPAETVWSSSISTTHSPGVGLESQPVQETVWDPGAEVALRTTTLPALAFGSVTGPV